MRQLLQGITIPNARTVPRADPRLAAYKYDRAAESVPSTTASSWGSNHGLDVLAGPPGCAASRSSWALPRGHVGGRIGSARGHLQGRPRWWPPCEARPPCGQTPRRLERHRTSPSRSAIIRSAEASTAPPRLWNSPPNSTPNCTSCTSAQLASWTCLTTACRSKKTHHGRGGIHHLWFTDADYEQGHPSNESAR